jgi:ribosomal protein S18 acetylase RimI-like enzyme
MTDVECRALQRRDVPETADVLARAFADNPFYAWLYPRAASRSKDLRAFFERNLLWHLPHGVTSVAVRSARVVGTLTLQPPGGIQHGALRMITHWVLPTLRQQGLRTVRRLVVADDEFRKRYLTITGGRDYWHVHAVAVDPDHQGTGVGSELIAHGMRELARLRASDATVPVVLSTQRERNLPLYRRAGFELVNRQEMGSRGNRFASWFMQLR